jgi:glycosyltransferase involved in cell wall biosynthesis
VIFEALGIGAVPVVADFGGPGDIVNPKIGYKIPLVSEDAIVGNLERILKRLADDRSHLETLRRQGMEYARQHLTWDRKAQVVSDILLWATKRGAKPDLRAPERLAPALAEP